MGVNQIVHINTLVQSSCKIRIGKKLHRANFDNGAGKSVMSYSIYLLIADPMKNLLQSNYIRLTTAINIELVNKESILFTLKLGEIKFTHTFIVV